MLEAVGAFETVVSIHMFTRRYTEYVVVPVTSCTSVLDVPGSNAGLDVGYADIFFCFFFISYRDILGFFFFLKDLLHRN
jgi:hypothetical protein